MGNPKKERPFITRPRCIYTGDDLDVSDPRLSPSQEHIIPLALGGSHQFVTNDVSAIANSRAGREIDDEIASLLPFLMQRHRYRLRGNRNVVPNVKIKGKFLDLNAKARVDIDVDGNLSFQFEDEQSTKGNLFALTSTEERVRFLLKGRLEQAKKRQMSLVTPFGSVTDEEDIEIALLLADRNEGRQFKGANYA